MFTKLMNDLSIVYKGEIIYLPVKLKPFLEPWLATKFQRRSGFQQSIHDGFPYKNKKVIFFCEDELVKAYKKMPVPHVPEKITEEPFTIEFTLEDHIAKPRKSSKPWQHGTAKVVKRKTERRKLW